MDYQSILKICERAEKLGVRQGTRFTAMMDLELATKEFNLKLQDLLNSDDLNFIHDFVGIQNHIDRAEKKFKDCFLPRYAGGKE